MSAYTPNSVRMNRLFPHQPVHQDIRPDRQSYHYKYAGLEFTLDLTRIDQSTWRLSLLMTARPSKRTELVNLYKEVDVKCDNDIFICATNITLELNTM